MQGNRKKVPALFNLTKTYKMKKTKRKLDTAYFDKFEDYAEAIHIDIDNIEQIGSNDYSFSFIKKYANCFEHKEVLAIMDYCKQNLYECSFYGIAHNLLNYGTACMITFRY